jgi:hypothetical protein
LEQVQEWSTICQEGGHCCCRPWEPQFGWHRGDQGMCFLVSPEATRIAV